MNFNSSLADYPKAHNKYLIWLIATHVRNDRTLYDFFDSQEILIFIKPKGFKRFGYDIHRKVNLPKRDHWVNTMPGYKESRHEAEQAAFTRAFEILENKLTRLETKK